MGISSIVLSWSNLQLRDFNGIYFSKQKHGKMNHHTLEILFCKTTSKHFWKYIKVHTLVNIASYTCIFDIHMVHWLYSTSSSSCRHEMSIRHKNCAFYRLGLDAVKIVEFFFSVFVKIFRQLWWDILFKFE